MIDSHTHLDSCKEPNDELLARSRSLGLTKLLTVAIDAPSLPKVIAAAETYPEVYAAIGRHPNAATGYGDADAALLREYAAHPRCVAIGETGLDYFRDGAPAADQRRAFVDQIALAHETGKALVIHTRAADEETLSLLREHADGLKVILHCFSMPKLLGQCLEQGWWISFAGHVTYPANSELAESVAGVPDDKILVETDAPYLSPQPVRREKNRPDNVVYTAEFVAEQRGITLGELDALVTANAEAVFGW
jgi:TatD DNase family protein